MEEIGALQLYTGPDAPTGKMLNWVDWQVVTSKKRNPAFKPGSYHHRLEIFKHLDIRELELDSSFQSRLYSSDFLTSGKLLWHFKHYLAPAKGFAHIPTEMYATAEKLVLPPQIESKFPQIDFGGIKTPRLWLRVDLARDERVGDLRNFRFFDTNTFPVINRRKNHRNKYTMGQPALEVSLFEYADADSANLPDKLFSIDRVWDANDNEYSSHLDLMAFANPRKYMVVEEENDLKIKFNFVPTGKEAPDFVVVGVLDDGRERWQWDRRRSRLPIGETSSADQGGTQPDYILGRIGRTIAPGRSNISRDSFCAITAWRFRKGRLNIWRATLMAASRKPRRCGV